MICGRLSATRRQTLKWVERQHGNWANVIAET
jgi:hypothetical protein